MALEWHDPREPVATSTGVLVGSIRIAALGAAPVGCFLRLLRQTGRSSEAGDAVPEMGES